MTMSRDTALERMDSTDDEILQALQALWSRTDPCPADLVDRIGFALTVRELHAEVARLTEQPFALTRAAVSDPTEARTVSFSTDELSIMVTLSEVGRDRARLDGWLTWGDAQVEVTTADGTSLHVRADGSGRFVVDDLPHGQTRLLVRDEDRRPVVTPGFEV